MLQKFAEKYAASLGAKVIASREDGNTIIFVLNTGPKLTMTEAELRTAIAKAAPEEGAEIKPKPKKGKE